MRELGVIGVFIFIIVQLNQAEDINKLKPNTEASISTVLEKDSSTYQKDYFVLNHLRK